MTVPDFAPKLNRTQACYGAAALLNALGAIGKESADSDLATIIRKSELSIRELIRFALVKLASEDQQ
jgi:hypothetical protein